MKLVWAIKSILSLSPIDFCSCNSFWRTIQRSIAKYFTKCQLNLLWKNLNNCCWIFAHVQLHLPISPERFNKIPETYHWFVSGLFVNSGRPIIKSSKFLWWFIYSNISNCLSGNLFTLLYLKLVRFIYLRIVCKLMKEFKWYLWEK